MSKENGGFSLLGNKLKEVRLERRMTQSELSRGIVTRNMLSRIENGAALPSLPVLCRLAERLDMPVGYFIDDADDGTEARNRRLLDMIVSELDAEHYDTCIAYCDGLSDYEEIVQNIRLTARYRLAVQRMQDGYLKEAQKMFFELSRDSTVPCEMLNRCHLYRALLSGFLSDSQSGAEETYLRSLSDVAIAPHDLASLASLLRLLANKDLASAQTVFDHTVFAERAYYHLCKGRLLYSQENYGEARTQFIEALGFILPPPIVCYVLTLLEKSAAQEKDFENAYSYLERRRELVSGLIK